MQISVLLAEQIAELFLMILMGYVIVKLGLVTDDDSKILSKIVLYIVIPCVMINAFQIDYTPDKVQGMFLALVASVVLQVLLLIAVWIMGKTFHLDEVEVASIYYSNSGNLIVPIVTYVLGDEWVVYGCVFMAVQLIFMWTHGKYIISSGDRIDWRKIVLNINMIAIFIGAVLFSFAGDCRRYTSCSGKHDWAGKYDCDRYVDCRYEPSGYIYKSKSIRSYISKIVACAGAGTDYSENQWSGYMASTR